MTVSRVAVIGDLAQREFVERLRAGGLGIRFGPFDAKIRSNVAAIEQPLYRLYRDYPLLDGERVFSFHARLQSVGAVPLVRRRAVRFSVDGRAPHEDLPADQALAALEWGLNLVIAFRSHSLLLLHSAAVERHGRVLLLPAMPGDGKTTLCAGLIHRGWRLLSDEFGLVRPDTVDVVPLPRPLPLKNQSIDVIRAFAPEAELGPRIANTRKGTIAHVKAPEASIRAAHEVAPARWIMFPRWEAGASFMLQELPQAESFMALAINAFNYEMLGERAFTTVRQLVASSRCFRLVYSDLEQAIASLNEFVARDVAEF